MSKKQSELPPTKKPLTMAQLNKRLDELEAREERLDALEKRLTALEKAPHEDFMAFVGVLGSSLLNQANGHRAPMSKQPLLIRHAFDYPEDDPVVVNGAKGMLWRDRDGQLSITTQQGDTRVDLDLAPFDLTELETFAAEHLPGNNSFCDVYIATHQPKEASHG